MAQGLLAPYTDVEARIFFIGIEFLIVGLYTVYYSLSGCACLYRHARGKELERVRAVC
jgi:hypothetical protein